MGGPAQAACLKQSIIVSKNSGIFTLFTSFLSKVRQAAWGQQHRFWWKLCNSEAGSCTNQHCNHQGQCHFLPPNILNMLKHVFLFGWVLTACHHDLPMKHVSTLSLHRMMGHLYLVASSLNKELWFIGSCHARITAWMGDCQKCKFQEMRFKHLRPSVVAWFCLAVSCQPPTRLNATQVLHQKLEMSQDLSGRCLWRRIDKGFWLRSAWKQNCVFYTFIHCQNEWVLLKGLNILNMYKYVN